MSATHYLPVDPDYGSSLSDARNLIASLSQSKKRFERQAAAPQRRWTLTWVRRSKADMQSLRNFLRNRAETGDFFTFDEKEEARKYSVFAVGDLSIEQVGNEQWNMRLEIEEAVGKPLDVYAAAPLSDSLHTTAQAVGTSKVIVYSGYGFTAAYTTVTGILLDGVSLGNPASPYTKNDVPLGLHRVEFQSATAPVISNFQAVL